MRVFEKQTVLSLCGLVALVTLAYGNHFGNSFHFDDSHTVVDNAYIRDLSNLPLFFTDTDTFSNLPANRSWRPLVTASLAIDYWLASGLHAKYFQASTYIWFLIEVCLIYALFRTIFDVARPSQRNQWVALFAAALYGVHPAMAETVNYVIQRGDVYSTLGVVAALFIFVYWPRWRSHGLYLLPFAAALLSKPPALVFPAILFAYILLFEDEKPSRALAKCVPSVLVAAAFGVMASAMTPATYNAGAVSAAGYRITQPLVALRYFGKFFVPAGLTADTDHVALASVFDDGGWLGFLFVIALIAVGILCSKRRELRPIAFGLFWFILALVPTAIFPLAEVENDHRMFFPFVGLALSVCWAAALWFDAHPVRREVVAAACGLVLAASSWGTWQRNIVWRSDESLWYDVTLKSPRNGRGLMNYGLTQMDKGDFRRALGYFQRALIFNPYYYILEINLGVANGRLGNEAEAERHYARAIQLAPADALARYFYAIWLNAKGRPDAAIGNLKIGIASNPSHLQSQYLLMQIYANQRNTSGLRNAAQETLARFPSDAVARSWMARSNTLKPSAESYLDQSLTYYQRGKFEESIQAAREALKLRPGYAEAWNNIAASYNSMLRWDDGIQAALEAVRLKPDLQLAKNNLSWAISRKQQAGVAR
jgi:protein O-mannosyl-transferase